MTTFLQEIWRWNASPTSSPPMNARRVHRCARTMVCFGGSGTTLIAAEKNGRIARIMELDPKYVDVIVKRWEDFTGQKAVLESTGEPFKAAA